MSAQHAEGNGWQVDLHTDHHWDVMRHKLPAVTVWAAAAHDGDPIVFESPAELRELAGAILSAAGELERLRQ